MCFSGMEASSLQVCKSRRKSVKFEQAAFPKMYRISQLMSTPVANSSGSEKEDTGELSPTCLFPSFVCDSQCGDSSLECSSIDHLAGSHFTCRRSPRLLTNGYYIWTEDSFLCDKDGNITLSPSQTRVLYKENLVSLSASESWLHGSIFQNVGSPHSEDIWLEGVRRLDTSLCNENGGDFDSSLTDDWESEKPNAESVTTSSSHRTAQTPKENLHHPSPPSQLTASEHFQENVWDRSKASLLPEISFQVILLIACFIISACARWFLGGIIASVFTCSLVITTAYVVKSSFLSLAHYFKATAWTWFAKF
ncbi:transmembrane protein 71 isoform X2 [Phacochoerus africanus]|uniref:transmembrane protein 71 isoform X2 n=1 Tax=Phacochoerus africanus TaxID=41426 RepID=UPI001FDA55F7|nr:transmembrane protein 71 isoform X2 [Phacochoerus africanus]